MQKFDMGTVTRTSSDNILATNAMIRNTYILLSMTLIFSSIMAYISMQSQAQPISIGIFILAMFGLQILTFKLRNSAWGILATFAFTGFMGYTLGPILNFYMAFSGPHVITAAFGLTGAIFLSLSAYAMITRKDFSYLSGFLFSAMVLTILASLLSIWLVIPTLHLIVSCAVVLIFSGYILHETSAMIHGGQRNYILATISLYLSIYNLFLSLLRILSLLSGRRD